MARAGGAGTDEMAGRGGLTWAAERKAAGAEGTARAKGSGFARKRAAAGRDRIWHPTTPRMQSQDNEQATHHGIGGPVVKRGAKGRRTGAMAPQGSRWPMPQQGQRDTSSCATLLMNAATDSITRGSGGGRSNSARQAASFCVLWRLAKRPQWRIRLKPAGST